MDVRCERCRAQYVFDDEQVTPTGLTVQCTNCGHLFKVKKKELVVTVAVKPEELEGAPIPATAAAPRPPGAVAAPSAPPAAAPARAPEAPREPPREWRVRQSNGNTFTFRELTTLQKWIIEQKVARDDEISLAGDQWKRLGNIAELASFFQVVEAAERGKAAPAITPVPMSMPVYGVAIQSPPMYPPPGWATPSPSPLPPPPPAEHRPEPLPVAPPPPVPTVEVDLGPDELAAVGKGRGGKIALALLVLAAAGGGAAWWWLTHQSSLGGLMLLGKPPAEQGAVAVPLTIEVKPSADPVPAAPAPPAAAQAQPPAEIVPPVAAPEPVAERAVDPPPEPVKAAPKPAAAPRTPKAMLAQATKLRDRGDAARALELYGRVVELDPANVDALTGRGLCYLDLESYPPAEASFQAALGIDPDAPDALLGLAETYRWQGKTADAIRYYEKYLARHPGGEDADVARNALEQLRN
jgi:predicted Zn finger-like uncharacterized protein